MLAEAVCVRCFVSGRVQGVFYRASTAREAVRLKLAGWVRNLPDGRVEVLARGERAAIEALCGWLWTGPPGAVVAGVRIEHCDVMPDADFRVRNDGPSERA